MEINSRKIISNLLYKKQTKKKIGEKIQMNSNQNESIKRAL